MNDAELTSLAAKAFGNAPEIFNPLTDDGDALRLAMKCGINISMDDCVAWYRLNDSSNTLIEECWGGDYDPCYRRAIVRAAAAIGETL